jgi:SAM-dependent methyltransferase
VSERAVSFGAAAAAYERFRPGYPVELVDAVLAYAGRPVRTALEIGAGTGKATRAFAASGVAVVATDPDAAMLAELRRRVPDVAETTALPFEGLPLDRTHDLVFAAASLHWTRPEGRWDRIAALLVPGGVFASFGGATRLADRSLADAVRVARQPFLGADDVPSPDGTPAEAPMQWPGTELLADDRFRDIRQSTLKRRERITAAGYLGLLSTISAYLVLPEETRRAAFASILRVLPAELEVDSDITLHLARLA